MTDEILGSTSCVLFFFPQWRPMMVTPIHFDYSQHSSVSCFALTDITYWFLTAPSLPSSMTTQLLSWRQWCEDFIVTAIPNTSHIQHPTLLLTITIPFLLQSQLSINSHSLYSLFLFYLFFFRSNYKTWLQNVMHKKFSASAPGAWNALYYCLPILSNTIYKVSWNLIKWYISTTKNLQYP